MKLWQKWCVAGAFVSLLVGCQSHPTDQGQQYKDGRLKQDLQQVSQVNVQGRPINSQDFYRQVNEIKNASPRLFQGNNDTYHAIENWLVAGGDPKKLASFNLTAFQMEGVDNYGNVQFTGYYTPVIQARRTKQGNFSTHFMQCHLKGKNASPAEPRYTMVL